MTKRLFDLAVAAFGIGCALPVLLAACVAIKREDGGPVLYGAKRVGRGGREFRMWKFRTMVPNADKIGGPNTPDDDVRLTRIGRKLRKHKLDELPQLFNVLAGEMSLVGPRPEVPEYVALYSDEERRLLSVRPGVTDWASIRFRNEGEMLRGSEDPEKTYFEVIRPEKIRLGLEYVGRHSLLEDLRILLRTARAALETETTLKGTEA